MNIIPKEKVIIQEIVAELKRGKIIVYPTETCYGLGCDALNAGAVAKIFKIKGRETNKSLLMIAADTDTVRECVEWNNTMEKLANKYWPGSLTIVTRAVNPTQWPAGVIGADNTLAFRVSNYPLVASLARGLGRPIVSTSANLAGEENPYRVEQIINSFAKKKTKPDIVIDAGDLPLEPPSTIVQVFGNHIKILRQGLAVL